MVTAAPSLVNIRRSYKAPKGNFSELLTIFPVPYTTSPGVLSFISGSLCLLTTFNHFAHPRAVSLATTDLVSVFYFIFRFHVQVKSYVICLSLTSFSIMSSTSIHVVTNGKIVFFMWMNMIPFIYLYIYIHIYITIYLFIYPWMDGQLVGLHILVIVDNAEMS